MKAVLVIAMVLMAGVCYADQTAEITMPDSFSAVQVQKVIDYAQIQVDREIAVNKNLVVPDNVVTEYQIEVDRVRKLNSSPLRFTVVAEEIAIEK